MTLPATDAFTTGSNQTLTAYSANWTNNSGSFQVVLATTDAKGNGLSENLAHWNADTFANDQYAAVKLNTAPDSTNDVGAAVRVAAAAYTGYILPMTNGGDNTAIYKIVTSTFTKLGGIATVMSSGDVMRLEASGTSISAKRNGTLVVGAFTDSAIASGFGGLWSFNNGPARIDDFEAGNLGGATTAAPPIPHRAYRMWKKRR